MDRPRTPRRAWGFRPIRAASVALFALVLLSGPAFAACSGAHGTNPVSASAATNTAMSEDMPMAGAGAAWTARPAYVKSNASTEEAYAFAISHPQIVAWMPCYCGCEAMGHGSNLDCYFKHGQPGDKPVFEEHASFCDVCVQITLKTKQLNAEGKSLHQIRQVIDQTFGGSGAPGTLTAQPPV
jgi:hypothetical protein